MAEADLLVDFRPGLQSPDFLTVVIIDVNLIDWAPEAGEVSGAGDGYSIILPDIEINTHRGQPGEAEEDEGGDEAAGDVALEGRESPPQPFWWRGNLDIV